MTKEIKVTPWEVSGKVDYNKLVKEFGISKIDQAILDRIKKGATQRVAPNGRLTGALQPNAVNASDVRLIAVNKVTNLPQSRIVRIARLSGRLASRHCCLQNLDTETVHLRIFCIGRKSLHLA